MKSGYAVWASVACCALGASIASAQNRPVSGGGNPLETLPQINVPQKPPSVSTEVKPQAPQMQQLLGTHLTPASFQVEGVKSVPFDEVAKHFAPFVNKDTTIGQLIDAANDVTKLYQERGYVISFAFVPVQTFEKGVVRIVIVEGYVGNVEIKGDTGAMEGRIRAIAAHIAEDRPLRRETFERYMQVLGLLPGLQVKGDIKTPTTTDGKTTLELSSTHKPYSFSTGIDFHHPGVQGLITATENGMTALGEQLSVSALAPSGRDDVTYYGANFAVPIASDGLMLKFDASHYHAHPADNPGLPSYVTRTVNNDKVSASLSYPFILGNTRSLFGTASLYAAHNEDGYRSDINGAELAQGVHERVLELKFDYMNVETSRVRKAGIAVAKGLPILGASKSAETNVSGIELFNPVSLTFGRFNISASQADDWSFGLGTVISMIGQYGSPNLPTPEQITFGAQRFAQGYGPGEAAGDSGWGMSFEVNHGIKTDTAWVKTITPYLMFDMARVYLHSGTPLPARLSSASIGFRITDAKHYNLDLSVAKALADAPINNPSRNPRINATFSYQLD